MVCEFRLVRLNVVITLFGDRICKSASAPTDHEQTLVLRRRWCTSLCCGSPLTKIDDNAETCGGGAARRTVSVVAQWPLELSVCQPDWPSPNERATNAITMTIRWPHDSRTTPVPRKTTSPDKSPPGHSLLRRFAPRTFFTETECMWIRTEYKQDWTCDKRSENY